jgi:thymidylate synthase
MHIKARSMDEAYRKACQAIYLYGDDIVTRGLKVRELTNVTIELKNPRDRIISSKTRAMSMRYMVGEMCFYLNGSTILDDIAFYGPFWRKVSDDGQFVNSAYGYRLFRGQFKYAVNCLVKDEYSRKAVMPIYTIDDAKESKDNPCTMCLQFLVRADKLDMYVHMRSNDVWLGLPYDVAFFTLLQEIALVELQQTYPFLTIGTYYHNATSLHCYEEHVDELWDVKSECGVKHVVMPQVDSIDVKTWFRDLLEWEEAYRTHGRPPLPFNILTGIQGWLTQWLR